MKRLFTLSILVSAVTAVPPIMDVAATRCNLIGSGTVICRSCPSLNCDSMASWSPGNYVNVGCMCHGQMQGGSNVWLYVNNKDCYIRQPRTNCCENCMPMCNNCPCTGSNCGGCGPNGCGGGGGGGNCGPNGCGGGNGGGNCGGGGCGGGSGGCTGSHCHDAVNSTLVIGAA